MYAIPGDTGTRKGVDFAENSTVCARVIDVCIDVESVLFVIIAKPQRVGMQHRRDKQDCYQHKEGSSEVPSQLFHKNAPGRDFSGEGTRYSVAGERSVVCFRVW